METQDYTIRAKPNGSPKLWIEGKRLERAGFLPGLYYRTVAVGNAGLQLEISPTGARKVSGRAGKKPIVELTGGVLADAGLIAGLSVAITYAQNVIRVVPD